MFFRDNLIIGKLGSVVGDNSSLFNLTISEGGNVHYHIGIVDKLCSGFRFGSLEENQFRCVILILGLRLRLLSLLDKKLDVKKSRRRPESVGGLLTASVQLEMI
ncbi:unnamed protein product [Hymenolepis diminuta]|uniref:LSM14 domain-containing protein n=1 Tax=Hymenolepis diminuta TaxID=6216 RepID=A0A0R3SJ95_HYMDI|nr:unnamed protein product [Hymenolepis diminuta]